MTLSRAKGGEWEAWEVSPIGPQPPTPTKTSAAAGWGKKCVLMGAVTAVAQAAATSPLAHCHQPPGLSASSLAHSPALGRESKAEQATSPLTPWMKSTLLGGNFKTPDGQASFQFQL